MAWIYTNAFLSQSEMENNVLELGRCMISGFGWSMEAVAAMAGNMESESTINPGIWEGLDYMNLSVGFGLVQWTPATKYINWAGGNWQSGDRECDRIKYEVANDLQWFANNDAPTIGLPVNPPLTFAQFVQSTLSPQTLAMYFIAYYEHPYNINQPNRGTQALAWYQYLSGHPFPGHVPLGAKVQRRGNKSGYIRRKRLSRY